MKAGQLRERIIIDEPSTGQDEAGQPDGGSTPVLECWADVEDISGREFIAGNATINSANTRMYVRWRETPIIKPTMRVTHKGIRYNIESVLGKDKIGLTLMCKLMITPYAP
jgi:SPP1 family predicted phage head-tail adaptor